MVADRIAHSIFKELVLTHCYGICWLRVLIVGGPPPNLCWRATESGPIRLRIGLGAYVTSRFWIHLALLGASVKALNDQMSQLPTGRSRAPPRQGFTKLWMKKVISIAVDSVCVYSSG